MPAVIGKSTRVQRLVGEAVCGEFLSSIPYKESALGLLITYDEALHLLVQSLHTTIR
jgi:hypothetical protein